MQTRHIKYILAGTVLSVIIWYIIIELDSRSGALIFWSLDPFRAFNYIYSGYTIPGIIAITIGSYVGLWRVGKIRKPSFAYGISLGLLSFILFLPMEAIGIWVSCVEHGWRFSLAIVVDYLRQIAPFIFVVGLIGGLLGVAVVRRISPMFCPNCGSKLPPGSDPCSKCGTKEF